VGKRDRVDAIDCAADLLVGLLQAAGQRRRIVASSATINMLAIYLLALWSRRRR
jgi:hypothetical protein